MDEFIAFHRVRDVWHDIEHKQGDGDGEDTIAEGEDPIAAIG
jgi:hypothetical protein